MITATTRHIRRSGYGDYFAIDYIDKQGKIIETPLYLKKGQQAKIKMRWDTEINGISNNWMEPALIRFDGEKVEVAYETNMSGTVDFFEPTENELLNPSIIHYKI